jgi:hypothetical protein
MRMWFIFLLSLISTGWQMGYAQIGSGISQEGLAGEWQNTDFGFAIVLVLRADGTGSFDGDPINYAAGDGKLNITMGAETEAYMYALQQDVLTLSGGDLPSKISFTRLGGEAPVKKQPVNPVVTPTTELTGTWSGNNETLEFRADGYCLYLGQTFPYQANNGQVTFHTNQGNIQFAYSIDGNALTLSANGQQVVYTRGHQQAGNTGNKATSTGQVAMDLVGQWCWIDVNSYNQGSSASSRCITLNADGTYTYFSDASRSVNTPDFYGGTTSQSNDSGTWSLQGDRIYYQSSQYGAGSYKLERRNHPRNVNDPMIVLDGEAYVTATARPPWK